MPGIELNALQAPFYLILMITLLVGTLTASVHISIGFRVHLDLLQKLMNFCLNCCLSEGATFFISNFDIFKMI